jgi:hypothetical protein
MPGEWQAVQLFVTVSTFGPGGKAWSLPGSRSRPIEG